MSIETEPTAEESIANEASASAKKRPRQPSRRAHLVCRVGNGPDRAGSVAPFPISVVRRGRLYAEHNRPSNPRSSTSRARQEAGEGDFA